MTERRVRARPGEGDQLRAEILVAAEALLVEAGSDDALTLRAVARRTGVTTPSVYRHFADRDALVTAVCLRSWDGLDRRIREATDGVADPFRRLGLFGRAYARFALDHPVQYRVLLMRPARPGPAEAAANASFRHIVDAVSACVEQDVFRGDPETLALGMWSAVHGCVSLLIARPAFEWPADVDGLIDSTVRMAGFGTALTSRLPAEAIPAAAELAGELDDMAARLARRRGSRNAPPGR